MNTLSDEQLKELEALYQKATPGPVELRGSDNATPHILHGDEPREIGYPENLMVAFPAEISHDYNSWGNAKWFTALHNAFPTILSTIQSLRTQLDDARDDSEELRKIKDYLWPNQTGMPNEHRNAHIAIEARHRLMMAAKEKAEQESASLRTELAAAKEDLALTKFRLKAADQGLQELDEENARFRIALTEIASYDKEKKHGDGICPYGCDTPFIAQRALYQPPQSPWRPKFKVGDKVRVIRPDIHRHELPDGVAEGVVKEVLPDDRQKYVYICEGIGSWFENQIELLHQPPTKGEKS